MKWSQTFIPTLRKEPREAELPSHQLMLKAGLIRKVASGVYIYLPLGLRVLRKIENIIREELNKIGAEELLLSILQPKSLWEETGRWSLYGKELFRLRDRANHEMCLAPTHEEEITALVRQEIRSWRQLPRIFYQIQTKFRDEIRPRFGVMRCRELSMKDAYSFDRTEEEAKQTYQKILKAYQRIFERCGLRYAVVDADVGTIGGSFSQEFMVLAQNGEEEIIICAKCQYASNVKLAPCPKPSQEASQEEKPISEVKTPGKKTVDEVTSFLKANPHDLIKTLIYKTRGKLYGILLRGNYEVSQTKLEASLNLAPEEEITLVSPSEIFSLTTTPYGFTGPVGLKDKNPELTLIGDYSLLGGKNFICGGNKKDIHLVNVNLERDFKVDVWQDIRKITPQDACPSCGQKALQAERGIEVGHIFMLGTKYTQAMKVTYVAPDNTEKLIHMGCYGIGPGRTIAAAIEQNYDADGIIWPSQLAPFKVLLLPLDTTQERVVKIAEKIYHFAQEANLEPLLDDRKASPGVKFKDGDLIGIPVKVIIGQKFLEEGKLEIKLRRTRESFYVEEGEVIGKVKEIL